jgi:CheY-like chemotaxis protein
MAKTGPIIIIEDDQNEQEVYRTVFKEMGLKNEILFFENGRVALDYLQTTKQEPFLIICNISMPEVDGLDLRRQIIANPYLRKKGTPFVFRTGSATTKDIKGAYELGVQGFFNKTNDLVKFKNQMDLILDYWMESFEIPVMENKLE